MIYIETPRLLLRDWKEEDLVPFAKMNCDPHVMKYFLNPRGARIVALEKPNEQEKTQWYFQRYVSPSIS